MVVEYTRKELSRTFQIKKRGKTKKQSRTRENTAIIISQAFKIIIHDRSIYLGEGTDFKFIENKTHKSIKSLKNGQK